ncbi:hypothetical protein [Clostridium celatum]|uniref:Uncharacterized protein n=2 Tax=Clostridium celatum TaxID=36834 RepID=L1QL74_9CLOT|nr:hypothetical protein [Clostridium celatum]EKY28696.1 hypothetical protein HMPREF0216_00618 [Clostridium celatum DSM 1785]
MGIIKIGTSKKGTIKLKIMIVSLFFISIVCGTVLQVYGQDEKEKNDSSVIEIVENTQGADVTDGGYNSSNTNDEKKDNDDSVDKNEDTNKTKDDDETEYISLENDIYASDSKIIEDKINKWNFINEDNKKVAY